MDRDKHDKRMWILLTILVYIVSVIYLGYNFTDKYISHFMNSQIILYESRVWLQLDNAYSYIILVSCFIVILCTKFILKEAIPPKIKLPLKYSFIYSISFIIYYVCIVTLFVIFSYFIMDIIAYIRVTRIINYQNDTSSFVYLTKGFLRHVYSNSGNVVLDIKHIFISFIIAVVINVLAKRFIYTKYISAPLNHTLTRINQKNTMLDKPSDIRDDLDEIKSVVSKIKNSNYSPKDYFRIKEKGNHKQAIFLCKSVKKDKAIYIPIEKVLDRSMPHFAVTGASGYGKGVFSQVFLTQTILMGFATIVFDPNEDQHMLKNLKYHADKRGVKFHYIDFKDYTKPQFDLLQNCDEYSFDLLTDNMFPFLEMRSADSNFYAMDSRKIRELFSKEAKYSCCMADLVNRVKLKYPEADLIDSQGNTPQFITEFEQISEVPICRVTESINFAKAIENGDVIYINCPDFAYDNYRTLLCKSLFNRLLNIIKSREEKDSKHVFFFIDELAEFVNKNLKSAIEQVRKKGCTFLFNMTSYDSLLGARTDIDTKSFVTSVRINSYKLTYCQPDASVARDISSLTGEKVIHNSSMNAKVDVNNSTVFNDNDRRLISDKENLISSGAISNLPPKVGVLMKTGESIPELVYTGILTYPDSVQKPKVNPAELYSIPKKNGKEQNKENTDSNNTNKISEDHKSKPDGYDNNTVDDDETEIECAF